MTFYGGSHEGTIEIKDGEHNIVLNNIYVGKKGLAKVIHLTKNSGATANVTLRGENTITGFIHVAEGTTFEITQESTGSLRVVGDDIDGDGIQNHAAIGGGYNETAGTVNLYGGYVEVEVKAAFHDGYHGAIGNGLGGSKGDINIKDCKVVVLNNKDYTPHGMISGFVEIKNAFVFTQNGIDTGNEDSKNNWSGVIFEGNEGKLYGDSYVFTRDNMIQANTELTIDAGQTLVVGEGVTLTNNGTLTNHGIIKNYGTITGTQPEGIVQDKHSTVIVTFEKDGQSITSADYGDTITIKATTAENSQNRMLRSATINTVDFYVGTGDNQTKLNTSAITVRDNTATFDIMLTGENWKAGTYTITAEYGGSNSLFESTGTTEFTVNKATPTVTSPTTENPTSPTEVVISVKSNDKISGNTVGDALEKAKDGANENGIVVKIKVETAKNANSLLVILTKEVFKALVKEKVKSLQITSDVMDIHFELQALKQIQKQLNDDVTIKVVKAENKKLSDEAKTIVGNRPVYDFTVVGGKGKQITDFKDGRVSVFIPYELQKGETSANISAYYIDSNGKATEMPNSLYDSKIKTLSFVTDHFSKFAVGYVTPPTKVGILKAANVKGRASLRWSRAKNYPDGYRVYRSKTKNGKYQGIAWIKDGKAKTYKEKAKKTNKTYYYKVRAYKQVKGKKIWRHTRQSK